MVLERLTKKGAAVAGSGAGGFAGGLFNNPGIIILGALVVGLVFFSSDIRKAFGSLGESIGNIGQFQLPDITFPSFEFPSITFPDITFPDITFPSFDFGAAGDASADFIAGLQEQFNQFLEGFGGNGGGGLPLPPDVEDTGLIEDVATVCPCGSNVVQDIMGDVSQTCIPCPEEEFMAPLPGDPSFIGPVQPDEMFSLDTFGQTEQQIEETFAETMDQLELPGGFVGGGPSFEGGTIFETDICNKSIGQIASENGISASAAADLKFQACETSTFDFGTNTGSGFGPGDDPLTDPLVTGGATLESEEQRAACTTCELFGLNCAICRGEAFA